ncbi:hypothetical protein NDU88_002931 [Pleurodeles waltl]|uniref:Uncharacterized protein n=1 Tax=Pleurodeles waltl TaxID=8319 RepID=A0AAV7UB92_PLEWA|nr:hypothetical protein NDU88_002931 [Pleurodeles waltl]
MPGQQHALRTKGAARGRDGEEPGRCMRCPDPSEHETCLHPAHRPAVTAHWPDHATQRAAPPLYGVGREGACSSPLPVRIRGAGGAGCPAPPRTARGTCSRLRGGRRHWVPAWLSRSSGTAPCAAAVCPSLASRRPPAGLLGAGAAAQRPARGQAQHTPAPHLPPALEPAVSAPHPPAKCGSHV